MIFGVLAGILLVVIFFVLYVLIFSFTIWMIIDAGKNDKFWWLVLVVGIPIIGPIIYYFVEKIQENKTK